MNCISAVPGRCAGSTRLQLSGDCVSTLLTVVAWCLLLVLCWPLALAALVLWPIVWLVSLPLRLVGIGLEAMFAFLRAVLFLPARMLGHRRTQT